MPNASWYTNGIFYAIDVEKYADGDGDGIGDFHGLIEKLDYLSELGVDCLWLLPFYPSPRRDNGYDPTDYYDVDPRFGTLADFDRFVRMAGERGMRVMLDIVMDHTSDEHPWFQAARRDPSCRFRDYYTWADIPPRDVAGHGSAFPGEEDAFWTFDEVAGNYYYHPFYRFQPQLNMSNPAVNEELYKLIDFWLAFGVAGFRLDAVPLMLGLDGPAVNVPDDPHGILRAVRAQCGRAGDIALMGEVDIEAGRLLHYFGEGDELGALLNFQLNNYLFLALATENPEGLLRGMTQLPPAPECCQWVNFLRNHDELNLQWLEPEERDTVWDLYAPDHSMRIYGRGIRRRLAPMLGDTEKLKMALSMLFALPGTPVMLYGDELGMGERLDLPGRDAVRVPMQWNAGKNAGFTDAPGKRLVRPVVDEGPFDYRSVNVEAQEEDPDSVLNWVRDLARVRAASPAIGEGNWRPVEAAPDGVLAYWMVTSEEMMLLVHNLRRESCALDVGAGMARCGDITQVFGNARLTGENGHTVIELDRYGSGWFRCDTSVERVSPYA